MDATDRIKAASQFLLQSPPGEINDVLNGAVQSLQPLHETGILIMNATSDIRYIISDDDLLQEGIQPALREYNIEQFTVVDVPETNHQSIISEAARVGPSESDGEERFLDPRSKTEASDPRPIEVVEEHEPIRAALEAASLNYLKAHFTEGVTSVFAPREGSDHFVLQIVANKYNPSNFWSGRWRSEYTIDLTSKQVSGRILINIHYYEQGNVQLATTHTVTFELPPAAISATPSTTASKILALIEVEEGKYQMSLGETYQEMGEKTFKGLRRALPLTRQKIDWDKVMGYKLGAELSGNKNALPSGQADE
ncbi:F-actin-capping protein subunit alpha-2 [Psilocybe cubensis]|uniref:F-actin-capping protein subunit alpha-2 n=2 Tax=Psilocybe cubensis TaxID=181762 RepID=A0ACB8GXZ0_PSICU|nr:F-actin-capping protein subunit alpha-2 [Psilocybe cubensis]KAH9480503.1 F-actin-capping protein subunit alpha-2 [Psilocybe cubensis]